MKKQIAALILSGALAACGGGGGSDGSSAATSSTASAPQAPAKAALTNTCRSLIGNGPITNPKCRVTVYMSGDSTNYGSDKDMATYRVNPPPVALLQALADSTYGPGVVNIIDGSVPGTTAESDINGTPPSIAPLATRLASLPVHADIVMTNTEINDQYVLGSSVAQYTADITTIMNIAVQYGARFVYQEPNPICTCMQANIAQTNAMVRSAEQAVRNAQYYVAGNLTAWENSTVWQSQWISSDCVHPNPTGYAQKANNYFYGSVSLLGETMGLNNAINDFLSTINL